MIQYNDELWLFTPEEYEQLPDNTLLTSISGIDVAKGSKSISLDTRFGHIAYGVRYPSSHPLKELFLVFMLKQ